MAVRRYTSKPSPYERNVPWRKDDSKIAGGVLVGFFANEFYRDWNEKSKYFF